MRAMLGYSGPQGQAMWAARILNHFPTYTGMTTQLVFTVPKKGSSKLHLVNDHSAGTNSLNSLIPEDGGFVKLDNISNLVTNIHAMMAQNGGHHPTWLWKSDTSQAYHWLPMHPQWQVCQATLIDGNYHIDQCAVFGN